MKLFCVTSLILMCSFVFAASAVALDTTDDMTGIMTARGDNSSHGEGVPQAFDNNVNTKWLDFSPSGSWIQYQYAFGKRSVVTSYTLTSANDSPERDPKDWNLLGSNDGGITWVTLDTRSNAAAWTARFQKLTFTFTNTTAYNIYRLSITALRGPNPNSVQLAEIELIGTVPVGPAKAIDPSPADNAVNMTATGILAWEPGLNAKSHDVYFGTVLADVNSAQRLVGDLNGDGTVDHSDVSIMSAYWLANPAGTEPFAGVDDDNIVDFFDFALLSHNLDKTADSVFKGNHDSNSFDPGLLSPSTIYYWRVDEVNGPNTVRGDIWSFTTQSGKAYNPVPLHNAKYADVNPTLSWSAGTGAQSHNVYFGTANPPEFQVTRTVASFIPGELAPNTTYFWRVDEIGLFGTVSGDIWTFTTTDPNNTLVGKMMCGYQGWFACPGDGSGRSWAHWSGGGSFDYFNLKVEMWPDMNDYDAATNNFLTGFDQGSPPYYVFSSYKSNTQQVHFSWMQEYGIDGVFVQRFGSDFGVKNFLNTVLTNCKNAANTYKRKYAIMYDLTGYTNSSLASNIETDWLDLENNYGITTDPLDKSYIIHNGKPVIAIYGLFGQNVSNYPDPGLVAPLVQWFKDRGFTILLGVNNDWLDRYNSEANFKACIDNADIIMPWNVGRYSTTTDVVNRADGLWTDDLTWCNANGKEYLICVFPGFSWHNWNGGSFDAIPRRGGQFLWDQYYNAKRIGATMLYQAMFDEVDESSAIFKVSNNPPPPYNGKEFLTLQGLPSDEYLWLAGQGTKMLRGELAIDPTRPVRP